jgi:DNA replication and repair protein RecF
MVVFHVKHGYLTMLATYQRILRQRNAALRTGHAPSARAWDEALVEAASMVDSERQALLNRLVEKVTPLLAEWPIGAEIRFRYQSGWNLESDLMDLLAARMEDDLRQGYTGRGPHRAELEVMAVNGDREHPAAKVLSRGQLKLLVIALNLAVFDVIAEGEGVRRPVWLLDDLAAELDASNRTRVISALHTRATQTFVTRLNDEALPTHAIDTMFHVEQGRLL